MLLPDELLVKTTLPPTTTTTRTTTPTTTTEAPDNRPVNRGPSSEFDLSGKKRFTGQTRLSSLICFVFFLQQKTQVSFQISFSFSFIHYGSLPCMQFKTGNMRAPPEQSQNILITPWWLAAAQVLNPESSVLPVLT